MILLIILEFNFNKLYNQSSFFIIIILKIEFVGNLGLVLLEFIIFESSFKQTSLDCKSDLRNSKKVELKICGRTRNRIDNYNCKPQFQKKMLLSIKI